MFVVGTDGPDEDHISKPFHVACCHSKNIIFMDPIKNNILSIGDLKWRF